MENIFAYTDPSPMAYPAYVSLNRNSDGTYYLAVRSSGTTETSGIEIPFGELVRMSAALNGETGLDLNNG